MFTPKSWAPLAIVAALLLSLASGCTKSLDSPEFGELIDRVPPKLDRPFPMPELQGNPTSPLAGPQLPEAEETPADNEEKPAAGNTDVEASEAENDSPADAASPVEEAPLADESSLADGGPAGETGTENSQPEGGESGGEKATNPE